MKIVIGLIFSLFCALSLFGNDNNFTNKEDYLKDSELYKRDCDSGYAQGCFNLANYYYNKTKQDYSKFCEYYEKACDGRYVQGCLNLGELYNSGQDVKQDKNKAKEFYRKACTLGDQQGCDAYAKLNK